MVALIGAAGVGIRDAAGGDPAESRPCQFRHDAGVYRQSGHVAPPAGGFFAV